MSIYNGGRRGGYYGARSFFMRRKGFTRRPKQVVLVPARMKSRRRFRRGRDRTGGYYGRFSTNGHRGAELKFHDLDIDDAAIAVGGTISQDSINLIAQGVTESTRIGRKCNIRNIGWKFELQLAEVDGGANPLDPDTVRVILYLDKQANGATAAVTDILESNDYQSFNNLANKSRFRTLMDRTYELNTPAGGGNGTTSDWASSLITDSFYKKCSIPIEYDATTGAITEIRSNNIGVLLLSRNGLVAFRSKMRVRFSDN